ncbi:MAG: RIP metalloprotease RseP [Alphaproteobacteria bacterium]|nr:RIP metalloprotease RseP [Alphaproteobacteria bacterium]
MSIAGFPLEQLLILPIAVVAFIVLLTIIVFFHEYGHFSAARALGIRVDVFSIGFGRPIARWTDRKGTEWRISMLPLGGYVKFFGDASGASNPKADIAGEIEDAAADDSAEPSTEDRARPATTQFPRPGEADGLASRLTPEERAVCFHFKPVWARAIVVAAGPMANFILATAIFWVLLISFGSYVVTPKVGEVVEDSAAAEAGFVAGDLIVSVNGRKIARFDELTMTTRLSSGEELRFEVERDGERLTLYATPRRQEIDDAFGNVAEAGVLGIVGDASSVTFVRYAPLDALKEASRQVWRVISGTLRFLSRLVVGKEDTRQLGGPIKMAQYAGQSAMSGFEGDDISFLDRLKVSLGNFINLAAVVSVSIGFLNLLPVPVLDGGHLLYYAYEGIAGRPLGARAQAIGFQLGMVLLASFMIFVTWNDIANLLSLLG